MRREEVDPHCVHLQGTCQMLCTFSTDVVVVVKIQCCECLCEMKIVGKR